eukprot:4300500-Prymnesium_polylepis.1
MHDAVSDYGSVFDEAEREEREYMVASDEMRKARKKLARQRRKSGGDGSDELYQTLLTLRAEPLQAFFGLARPSQWALPIVSINEMKHLKALGVSEAERNQIQGIGLTSSSLIVRGGLILTETQLSTLAVVRLAQ